MSLEKILPGRCKDETYHSPHVVLIANQRAVPWRDVPLLSLGGGGGLLARLYQYCCAFHRDECDAFYEIVRKDCSRQSYNDHPDDVGGIIIAGELHVVLQGTLLV